MSGAIRAPHVGLLKEIREMAETDAFDNLTAGSYSRMIDRIKHYEAERLAALSEVLRLTTEVDNERSKVKALFRERNGEVWYWQGDSEDHLESLTCPVLIEAHDLRKIVSQSSDRIDRALKALNAILKRTPEFIGDYGEYNCPGCEKMQTIAAKGLSEEK